MIKNRYYALLFLLLLVLLAGCSPDIVLSPTSTGAIPNGLDDAATPTTPLTKSADVESGSPWQVVKQASIQHSTNVAGFHDADKGITVGDGGEIHFTSDGGENWPRADNFSLCRFGLDIVDDQVAWNCGNGGHVRISTDGGETWRPVSDFGPNEPDHCRYLSFIDGETGWAATPLQIGATADGGATWSDISLPAGANKIAAIALRTVDDGYLLDDQGNLFITQDGGSNWTTNSIELDEELGLVDAATPMAAMRWFDANNGLIVVSLIGGGKSKVLIYRTADGGQSWQQEVVPAQFGAPFLSRDGRTLTITHLGNKVTLLQSWRYAMRESDY